MKTKAALLSEGIDLLRQKDRDIDSLITPRYKEITSLLNLYIKEIELFNGAYSLVGAKNTDELIIKHILDSLAPLGIIYRLTAKVCADGITPQIADAGSGAGLPGIPLAIALPQYHFTLIERMKRRAGFLWNTKANLGLTNIAIEEGELEKTISCRFSIMTFRAFKPLEPKLLAALFNACAESGIIAAYKGRREKIEEEMTPLGNVCSQWETIPCYVPFLDEERHLLVISKQSATPPQSLLRTAGSWVSNPPANGTAQN